jgi:quinol monooxygenase YgiN
MSLPVLIGFAGVLVAAVATGVLAGRCFHQPRIYLLLWTAATFGLAVALAAQSMGFASGFGLATFRAVQLPTQLFAPLWLAWGLVELVAWSEAARFGMRLISSALTVIASVILATDPLTAQPFSKSWPSVSAHFQPISHYALDVEQVVAAVAVLASVALAVARARKDPRSLAELTGIFPVGLAVLAAMGLRLAWPDRSAYPLLSMLAAALIWFGVTRIQHAPRQEVREPQAGRGRGSGAAEGLRDVQVVRGGADDVSAGQYATYGHRWPHPPRRMPMAAPAPLAASPGPRTGGSGTGGSGTGGSGTGDSGTAAMAGADAEPGTQARAAGAPAAAPAKPYGRILIFTLLEDRVADFDWLAEQAAEQVRTGEPGTLVYVIHLVPNAPLQRIFYEVYRDPAAFDSHESQPYMQRFVADRRSCVLATNVIELRLKYAKIAPLPGPPRGAAGAPAAARLQPLPPPGAQRPDRPSQRPPAGRRYGGT